jgi:hypothetical protein
MTFLDDSNLGNNTANRIDPFVAQALGLEGFDQVVIHLGGSGAVDNVRYTIPVPEPSTAFLIGLGLSLSAIARRSRRS